MDIVTGAALRVVETYGGRSYTLRPPTYGEAGELASRHVGTARPGPAMVAEAIRQALEVKLGDKAAPHVAAISAHEEADDAVQSLLITRPLDSEPDAARVEWRRELREAQRALLAAERRRQVAEQLVAEAPAVVAARAGQMQAQMDDRLLTVRVCLVGWAGDELPAWATGDDGRVPVGMMVALPAPDLAALAVRCQALLSPSRVAEKN